MAELVVSLLALYRTFSGLPVHFCIDLAVSKCLEQKKYTILFKNKTSSPEKKNTTFFMLVMAAGSSMASSSAPKRPKSGVQHHLQLTFPSQATKEGLSTG